MGDDLVSLSYSFLGFDVLLALIRVADKTYLTRLLGPRQCKYAADFCTDIKFRLTRASDTLRAAHIEYEEYCLLFLFLEGLYKCAMSLCRHMPIDGTDIVTVLIRADVVEFKTCSLENGMKIPLHLAVDRLANLDFISTELFEEFSHPGIIFVREAVSPRLARHRRGFGRGVRRLGAKI